MVIDEDRGLLYAVSYPRDHMIVYDIEKRKRTDLGRIGSVNPQVLFIDKKHRIWTTSDYGRLVRYDPAVRRLIHSPYLLPRDDRYQTGWHNVFYDAVASPDGECVYALTWNVSPRLFRVWMHEGEWGRTEDLGPVSQPHDPYDAFPINADHAGGLVFGRDGMLYYAACRWKDMAYSAQSGKYDGVEGVLWRMNPDTLEREEAGRFVRDDGYVVHYISRGAIDGNGNLFFGTAINPWPVAITKVHVPEERKKGPNPPLRKWG